MDAGDGIPAHEFIDGRNQIPAQIGMDGSRYSVRRPDPFFTRHPRFAKAA